MFHLKHWYHILEVWYSLENTVHRKLRRDSQNSRNMSTSSPLCTSNMSLCIRIWCPKNAGFQQNISNLDVFSRGCISRITSCISGSPLSKNSKRLIKSWYSNLSTPTPPAGRWMNHGWRWTPQNGFLHSFPFWGENCKEETCEFLH